MSRQEPRFWCMSEVTSCLKVKMAKERARETTETEMRTLRRERAFMASGVVEEQGADGRKGGGGSMTYWSGWKVLGESA